VRRDCFADEFLTAVDSMADKKSGKIVIISGPSGVGKSTVVHRLIETCPLPLKLSVSATTRAIRADDKPGENYIFMSKEEFQARINRNEFLEFAEVFGRGDLYGTLKRQVTSGLKSGKWIILEIDVEGAAKALRVFPGAITIFIHPGSLEELVRRLRNRNTDDEDAIQRRLEVARGELEASSIYRYIVINRSLDQTVREICQVLKKSSEWEQARTIGETECTTN
jgi:guanylate kinase